MTETEKLFQDYAQACYPHLQIKPQLTNPKTMKFENLKFPAGIVFAVAILVPFIDYTLTGGYSTITYIVEGICAVAVVGLVVVGFVNMAKDK
jgi:hypothetical protein